MRTTERARARVHLECGHSHLIRTQKEIDAFREAIAAGGIRLRCKTCGYRTFIVNLEERKPKRRVRVRTLRTKAR